MKLRQSFATQDWRVSELRQDDRLLRFEILRSVDGGEQWSLIGACHDEADAHAIAALPQLYAACLEVVNLPKGYPNVELVVSQSRAALDAANAADEPDA